MIEHLPSKLQNARFIQAVGKPFLAEYLEQESSYQDYFAKKLDDLAALKTSGKLLDVGCGAGTFLLQAKARGWQVVGTDLSTDALKLCHKRGLKVIKGTLEELPKNARFDVITCFQTIEHLPRPDLFLKQAYSRLKPGGILLVTTPNNQGFLGKLMGKWWFEYTNLEHLYFFQHHSLAQLVRKSGFQVLSLTTESGRQLDLPYIWDRLSRYYYTPGTPGAKLVQTLAFVPKIFQQLPIKEPWVNCYLIATKTSD